MITAYIIVGLVAFFGSLLTFYSGFGLGTLLTPVFVLFFPIELAIAMTGIVHFLNNVFKLQLTYKDINWSVIQRFGIPAIMAAFVGAWLLGRLSVNTVAYEVDVFGALRQVTTIKLMLALLMILFVALEWIPRFRDASFAPSLMPLGGVLSGFFGGLAGFQGVLRSMFLLKSGLSKESYIATGIAIACCIDITRLSKYFTDVDLDALLSQRSIIMVALICALVGAYLGNKWLKKVTIDQVQQLVSVLLIGFSLCLLAGVL